MPGDAERRGGDFVAYRRRADGVLCSILGDLSAKRERGDALARRLALAFSIDCIFAERPGSVLETLNAALIEALRDDPFSGCFATALVCWFYPDRLLRYAAAGSDGPLHVQDRTCALLPTPGNLALGVTEGATYEDAVRSFVPGDQLIAFTDGVAESRHAASPKRMGIAMVADVVHAALRYGETLTANTVFALMEPHNDGRYDDDATIVVASGSSCG